MHLSSPDVTEAFGTQSNLPYVASKNNSDDDMSLLWLPYVLLTAFLIGLLLASFIHFHWKYRERYMQRDKLAKEQRIVDIDDIEAAPSIHSKIEGQNILPLSATRLLVQRAAEDRRASFSETVPRTQRQKGRLKMLYDNKVNVSSIVENSLLQRPEVLYENAIDENEIAGSSTDVPCDDDADYDRKYNPTEKVNMVKYNSHC